MRAVVQRASQASVTIGAVTTASIGAGLVVFLGVGPGDTEATARRLAARVAGLRVLADAQGRMNVDVTWASGEVLVVSQFTLHADTSRGHRPSFIRAAAPELAAPLCETFVAELRALGLRVATGTFGAHMAVSLVNDGPVTIVLSSGEGPWEADAG